MKKILGITFASLLFFTGCTSNEEKTMSCTRTATQGSMKLDLEYNVTYQGNNVKEVNSIEKIISDDSDILETYKGSLDELYRPYGNIQYYDYNVTIDDDTLTSTVKINYEKIDTDKLIDLDSSIGKVIKNGKVNIDDIQKMYESIGASCTR